MDPATIDALVRAYHATGSNPVMIVAVCLLYLESKKWRALYADRQAAIERLSRAVARLADHVSPVAQDGGADTSVPRG